MPNTLQALLAALLFVASLVVASSSSLSTSPGPGDAVTERALSPALRMSDNILIIHAVLAVLAWAFFAPIGAIILRLNLQSAPLLRIHGLFQILSCLMYIVAVGLGIWLARDSAKYKPTWSDPHPIMGLGILTVALFQPFLGLIHHDVFKKRLVFWRAGLSTKKPGRTIWGWMHVWNGRSLITLGVINGGFGIRLASKSPFQDAATTRKAYIGYGVVGGLMWLLYAGVSALFAYRRNARERRER